MQEISNRALVESIPEEGMWMIHGTLFSGT
jgi:hypothetical protein